MSITLHGAGGHFVFLLWLAIFIGAPLFTYWHGKQVGQLKAEQDCWDRHIAPRLYPMSHEFGDWTEESPR